MIGHTTLPGGPNKGLQKYQGQHSKGCTIRVWRAPYQRTNFKSKVVHLHLVYKSYHSTWGKLTSCIDIEGLRYISLIANNA